MSPVLLLILILAALIALIPVWRLRVAGWPARWLFVAWVGYTVGILAAVRAPGATRFLLPILVLAYVAPFVAGPERLTRVLRGPGEPRRPIIDVTPRPPVGLRRASEDEVADRAGDAGADVDPEDDRPSR